MRKILDSFFPLGTRRRNFLYNTKKVVKKLSVSIYKIIPFKGLKKVLKKSANKIGLYNNKNLNVNMNNSNTIIDIYNQTSIQCFELKSITAKIAVQLHLYYKDLADEMISYLNNIPFSFDLYISVVDKNDNELLEKKFEKIKHVKKVVIKVCKNSGRDFGPMMVDFGYSLSKYDYIAHIHTKKSLRTGAEQSGWRTHLLDGIMGSESLVRKIFYMFEHENIGIFFPDSYKNAPYWANTWMGASSIGRETLTKLGIPFIDEYQDFSVGSMFWVRVKACKEVFNKKWSYKEFGEEIGLNDGTLPYVFERIFVLDTKFNNYDFVCYNKDKNVFFKNFSERNMKDYYDKNVDTMFNKLKEFDVVSFDIFDTLLTRKIYSPDKLFYVMANKIKIDDFDNSQFYSLRKQAEIKAGENAKNNEPDINEIYIEFEKLSGLTREKVNYIKNIEFNTEKEYLIPRKDMLELFTRLKENGNRIIIVSDMYLTSDILTEILENCGYTGFEKLYVSSETRLRKDKGNVWDFIKKNYKNQTLIHVGDNEESDVHKLWDLDVTNEHVMQGKRMYQNTKYGYFNRFTDINCSNCNSILAGLIVNNKLFNSAFKFNENKNEYVIESLNEFGYSIVGPIILNYLLWLLKNRNEEETLLFLSREGYYFEKLFDKLITGLKISKVKKLYFNTSRRSVTVANIHNEEDIYELLKIEFYGDMKSFMHFRFGVEYKDKNFNVILCEDNPDNNYDEVKSSMKKYIKDILVEAEVERKNYLKYIKKNIKNLNNLCVVDLGYSGTTQLYLSKLLDKKISGKYLVVKNNPKPLSIGCKVESCFNDIMNDNNHLLYKNALFLECFLTAPYGQLICFDNNGKPKYIDEKLIKNKTKYLDEIYDGVKELLKDMIDLCGDDLLNEEFNKDFLVNNYRAFLCESSQFVNNNNDIFQFEDYYCRSENIVIEKQ